MSKSLGVGKYQNSDSTQPVSSIHGGSSVVRPLPSHNSRSQQVIGPQKGINLLYISEINLLYISGKLMSSSVFQQQFLVRNGNQSQRTQVLHKDLE